jgi:Tol biopolymer transport system component
MSIISRVRSLLALAFGVAALGFSSGSEAERPSGRFVFVGDETTAASVLWTVRADGTGARRLTRTHLTAEVEPEWSPDGRKIAYSRSDTCRADPNDWCTRIWTMNADGSDQRRLIPLRLPGLLANRAVSFYEPTWSPDGQQIAYEQSLWKTSSSNLYVSNADGSGRRRLTRLRNARSPSWSPDGNAIVFTHAPEKGADDIFVLTLATGKIHRLTKTDADESVPQWSPDGRRIAYEWWDGEEYEVFVMNADGSGRRNLSRRRGVDGGPVWSPGGELIAFASERGRALEPHIYIVPVDGTGRPSKVRTPSVALYELDWTAEPG